MRGDRLGYAEPERLHLHGYLDRSHPRAYDEVTAACGHYRFHPNRRLPLKCSSTPGSISQVRESTAQLITLAKSQDIPILIIGHVTKEGAIAGPRVLEHMVDTVLYFEGERHHTYRMLRAVKNRFGPTNEVGVFEMQQSGLTEVSNPSELFLAERPLQASGSTVVASVEGTRPLLGRAAGAGQPDRLWDATACCQRRGLPTRGSPPGGPGKTSRRAFAGL